MINWKTLLLKARKGALRFPMRIPGHGVVADGADLERQADRQARQELSEMEARAAFLSAAFGGPDARWLDTVDGGETAWDALVRTLQAKRAEPERPFHIGRLADTVDDPSLVPEVLAWLATIARVAGDTTLVPGPDARRVHVHGAIPGHPVPFAGRWAAEPGALGSLSLPDGAEPTVGVLPTWHAFLHTTPRPGTVLLWPDHGPWSLRRLDWLLDSHIHVWVGTRADMEGAARLRTVFGRTTIHLPVLPSLPREPGVGPDVGMRAGEQAWWKERGTRPLPGLAPPPGFAVQCLAGT
jgi:hypothetical protein